MDEKCGWLYQGTECGLPVADAKEIWCGYHRACADAQDYGAGHLVPDPPYEEKDPFPSPVPAFIEVCDHGVLKGTNPKDAIANTKVALGLCSPIASAYWSAAQFAGLTKYGAWNWRISGVLASIYLSAMKRHMDAYISGETHDPIDGTRHLGNIMACCAILLDAEAAGKLTDDRPPSVDIRATYAEVEANNKALKEKYKAMTPRHYTIADTEKKT